VACVFSPLFNVNGIQYDREENEMTGFREHLKNLATFDLNMKYYAIYICWFSIVFPYSIFCSHNSEC
jgi:hypothetical protein